MPRLCATSTTGGKGNAGMFIERDPRVCAAGLPSRQPDERVADCLQHYLLQEEADALIHDAIIPTPTPKTLPPLRKPVPLDMRNASIYTESRHLLNPPTKTKFEHLVDDLKETVYKSYWTKPVGFLPDQKPNLPERLDTSNLTFGKKYVYSENLYDLITPSAPLPDMPTMKKAAFQTDRNYCKPAYNPDAIFGHKTNKDISGHNVKCSLTYNSILMGTAIAKPINTVQADFKSAREIKLGLSLAPNDNIRSVPKGFTFGKPEPPNNTTAYASMITSEISPDKDFLHKCLGHLNTFRKCLSKRFEAKYFPNLYLKLKYYDKNQTGWLPKKTVYDYCVTQFIRFDTSLLEPLLSMWKAFDGSNIDYKMFVRVINYREPSPEIPKIIDFSKDCLEFRTTYSEMVKPGQRKDMGLRAGLPSGRYFDMDYPVTPDGCCRADRAYWPHENDMKCCLLPSTFTNLGVHHRDMYAVRDPQTVRNVFEAAGEKLAKEHFNAVWDYAKMYSSEGLVCFETFRKALGVVKFPDENKLPKLN